MIKRVIDVVVSSLGLVFLSPLFLVISIAIRLNDKGRIMFSQLRVGKDLKTFKLYKFRTMAYGAEDKGPRITATGDERITRVGRVLRFYKLDELPQLINVIQGEMSLVGPRPELKEYVELFQEDYREILQVRPGMTDYAAIEFRNEEEILSKFADCEKAYVEEILPRKIALYKRQIAEHSLLTDLKIMLRTIKILFRETQMDSDCF